MVFFKYICIHTRSASTNYHVHGSDVAMDNRLWIIDSRIFLLNIILRQGEQT